MSRLFVNSSENDNLIFPPLFKRTEKSLMLLVIVAFSPQKRDAGTWMKQDQFHEMVKKGVAHLKSENGLV